MIANIPNYVFIPAILVLGALLVLCIYHFVLFLHYKEIIILKYSVYLFSLAIYVVIDLYAKSDLSIGATIELSHLVRGINYIAILSYSLFLFEIAKVGKAKYKLLFVSWNILAIATMAYIIYCFLIACMPLPQLRSLNAILATFFAGAFISIGLWALFALFPFVKGTFEKIIKWGAAIYLCFMILVMATLVFATNKVLFGVYFMQWFYIGTIVEVIIFSFAISYKVKEALSKEFHIRAQMARDLHDDIGASLSSLQIYGAVAESSFTQQPEKAIEMLQKIAIQSKQIMENMNDIVWSMNVGDSNAISLEAKIKNYSVELLSNSGITFSCTINIGVEQELKNIAAKRNILLVIREALNNIAKYSQASKAYLTAEIINKELKLRIVDNGIGFDYETRKLGNGMGNMLKRVEELHGKIVIAAQPAKGTHIEIGIPVKSL